MHINELWRGAGNWLTACLGIVLFQVVLTTILVWQVVIYDCAVWFALEALFVLGAFIAAFCGFIRQIKVRRKKKENEKKHHLPFTHLAAQQLLHELYKNWDLLVDDDISL